MYLLLKISISWSFVPTLADSIIFCMFVVYFMLSWLLNLRCFVMWMHRSMVCMYVWCVFFCLYTHTNTHISQFMSSGLHQNLTLIQPLYLNNLPLSLLGKVAQVSLFSIRGGPFSFAAKRRQESSTRKGLVCGNFDSISSGRWCSKLGFFIFGFFWAPIELVVV